MAISHKLKPIDRAAITVIILLSFVLMGLLLSEKVCGTDCWFKAKANVREFSWEGQKISAEDRGFILNFSRPMNRESVENNLKIEPQLPGKISWSGKLMAYTLDNPAPYGTEYKISILGAKETLGSEIKPFQETFRTRDRAFVYIGVNGEEKGRLILYNLTQQEKTILTPPRLVVNRFFSYPDRSKILFGGTSRENWEQGKLDQKLYTVTTGINKTENPSGKIELILDNKTYQILEFELSPDGEKIVVRRGKKEASGLGEISLWVIENQASPQKLETATGGDFIIPPDSKTVAIAQGQGVALISLEKDSNPSNFLPQYGQVLTFSPDGTAAAMVNFNTQDTEKQYIRSLYLVTNRNIEKNLLNTNGSILSCEFNPTVTHIYCLLTELIEGEKYQEQPYLVSINLETAAVTPLLTLPEYRDVEMSLSPDGLALLFDQIMTVRETSETAVKTLRSDSGEAIIGSRLWLLVPTPTLTKDPNQKPQLEELPISGLSPFWLP